MGATESRICMSNSGLQDGREPISTALCVPGASGHTDTHPIESLPSPQEGVRSRLLPPGQTGPRSCSLASRAVLQCQLHKDKWDGHAGVRRPTKQNSGIGHDCAQASSDPSVSDPEPTPATGCFLTRTLEPRPLCELRAQPAVCPSGSWHTPKTRADLRALRFWGGNW